MRIVILRAAIEDLVRGREFYEQQGEGLGDYFEESLAADIDSLRLFAGIHAMAHGYHRSLSAKFPYAVYYEIVAALEGPELPFAGAMVWPVKPTHQIKIEFSTGENASASVIRFIVKEKNGWLIVIPTLTEENLKKYGAKKKASQPSVAPLPSAPQAGSSEGAR